MSVLDFNTAGPQAMEPIKPSRIGFSDAVEKFRSIVIAFGLLPGNIAESDGSIVRCPVVGDKPGQKSGWFVFYADGVPAGAYGNWRTSDFESWSAMSELEMTPSEVLAHRHRIDTLRELHKAEREKNAKEAADRAGKEWEDAKDVKAHPYLQRKGVESFGLRLRGGKLLVPLHDMSKALHGLQQIDSTGEKRFTYGCETKGRFFVIDGKGKIAICEGYATAATVHMATGWTTVVAFNANNLTPVCEAWRKARPGDEIVVCGDDDAFTTPENVGRKYADAASALIGAQAVYPDFSKAERGKATDWNDLCALLGMDEVKRQLGKDREYKVRIKDWGLDRYEGKAPERQWLIENILPMASVFVLAAMGDAGKGMLTLDLALKVAGKYPVAPEWSGEGFNTPITAFDNKVMRHGPVVIVSAEDDQSELHRRIENIGKGHARDLYIIPLPNAGGPMPLVVPGKNGPQATPYWHELYAQFMELRPVLINFDPLSSFIMADINSDPAVGSFTMGLLMQLAQDTGAAVVIAHHLAKGDGGISSPEQARNKVRGTSAIVDNSRAVYVLWSVEENSGRSVCKSLDIPWTRNRVFSGALVKSNGPGDREVKTFIRNDVGLLEVRSEAIKAVVRESKPAMLDAFERAIADAALRGQPFCMSGENGIESRKHELPDEIRDYGRKTILKAIFQLLESKRVFKCVAKGQKTKKYLDVPGGPFTLGLGDIVTGASDEQ